jgi:hypothetical protein
VDPLRVQTSERRNQHRVRFLQQLQYVIGPERPHQVLRSMLSWSLCRCSDKESLQRRDRATACKETTKISSLDFIKKNSSLDDRLGQVNRALPREQGGNKKNLSGMQMSKNWNGWVNWKDQFGKDFYLTAISSCNPAWPPSRRSTSKP